MDLKSFKGKPSRRETQTPHDKNYYPRWASQPQPNSKKKRRRNTNVSTRSSSSLKINNSNRAGRSQVNL